MLTCDFNRSGLAFETVGGQPLPPCQTEAVSILVEADEVVRRSCADHRELASDEHPEAVEYALAGRSTD